MHSDYGYFEESQLGKPYDVHLLRRLLPFARPYNRMLLWSIGLVVLITLLDLALPYLTKTAIDRFIVPRQDFAAGERGADPRGERRLDVRIEDPQAAAAARKYPQFIEIDGSAARIAYEDLSRLAPSDLRALRRRDVLGLGLLTGIFLALALVDFVSNFFQNLIMETTGHRIMHDLRMRLFDHIQNLHVGFFTRNPVGRLVTRATSDVQNMHELLTSFISFVFKDLFLLVGIAAVMLVLNWKLALVSFAVLPLVFYASVSFSRRARGIFRDLRVLIADINTRFAETIGGMRVLQLFRREAANYRRFAGLNHENYLAGMRQIHVLAVFLPLINALSLVAMAMIVLYGGGQVLENRLSLGALVAFISYIRMFFRPMQDLAEKYNILQNAMASAERIFLILDTADALPAPAPTARSGEQTRIDTIRLEDVWFHYTAGESVLENVDFRINRGRTVAVVGPTGAGKTSLVNLIPRFYDPTAGRILLNGRDLRDIDPAAYRSMMALVMQDPFLFSGTIRENIFENRQPANPALEERIVNAARLKGLIDKLPEGLDTRLSEGGASISSGERQLISIARAFARDPQLLLFDEATSYVDSQTELMIQEALADLMENRTALVIAHRLSTVRNADLILVLHRGRIIERGTHSELIAARGFYFHLNQLENGRESVTKPLAES